MHELSDLESNAYIHVVHVCIGSNVICICIIVIVMTEISSIADCHDGTNYVQTVLAQDYVQ